MTKKHKVLNSIQVLRAIAAILVVILHSAEQFEVKKISEFVSFGNGGVDLFFVISGFVMIYISFKKTMTPWQFFKNRIVRIAPIYWIFTLFTAVLTLIIPSAFRGTTFDLQHLLYSLFFVAHPNPATVGSVSPMLRVGWTLNYEMLFYAIFAMALFFGKTRVIYLSGACIIALVLSGMFISSSAVWAFYTANIMLEFLFGMVVGWVFINFQHLFVEGKKKTFVFLITLFSFVAFGSLGMQGELPRSLTFGVPAAFIVYYSLSYESLVSRFTSSWLLLLGNASYAMYLSHPFILSFIRVLASRAHIDTSSTIAQVVFIVFMTFAAALGGVLGHLLIEKPVGAFIKNGRKAIPFAE